MQTDGLVIPGFFNVSNSQNPVRGTNSLEEEKVNSVYGTLDAELFGGFGCYGKKRLGFQPYR
jgi:hypothetical protein